MQAHADKHAVVHILVPVEQALGMSQRPSGSPATRSENLTDIMAPLEEMLKSMNLPPGAGQHGGRSSAPAKRTSMGRDPESGAPLAERVDRLLAECGARQATLSQLQLDLTRYGTHAHAPAVA